MPEITERCSCGAEIAVRGKWLDVVSLTASRWRREHQCVQSAPTEGGDVITEAHDAGAADIGMGFTSPSMLDRWGDRDA